MRLGHGRNIRVAFALVMLGMSTGGTCRPSIAARMAAPSCNWTVSGARDATAADSGLAMRPDMLEDREPKNRVPGPGGLVAIDEIDSLYHSSILLKDPATGSRRRLISGSRPRWSPD